MFNLFVKIIQIFDKRKLKPLSSKKKLLKSINTKMLFLSLYALLHFKTKKYIKKCFFYATYYHVKQKSKIEMREGELMHIS